MIELSLLICFPFHNIPTKWNVEEMPYQPPICSNLCYLSVFNNFIADEVCYSAYPKRQPAISRNFRRQLSHLKYREAIQKKYKKSGEILTPHFREFWHFGQTSVFGKNFGKNFGNLALWTAQMIACIILYFFLIILFIYRISYHFRISYFFDYIITIENPKYDNIWNDSIGNVNNFVNIYRLWRILQIIIITVYF